jgi:hypothetical protein
VETRHAASLKPDSVAGILLSGGVNYASSP